MSGRIIFYMLATSLLLGGCSHSRPELKVNSERFVTKITEHGLKLFVYQLEMKVPGGSRGKSGGRPSSGGPGGKGGPPMQGGGGGGDQADGGDWVDSMLAIKLKENGFCRNGYIELERYNTSNGSIRIRGECKEGATAADREAFPNR